MFPRRWGFVAFMSAHACGFTVCDLSLCFTGMFMKLNQHLCRLSMSLFLRGFYSRLSVHCQAAKQQHFKIHWFNLEAPAVAEQALMSLSFFYTSSLLWLFHSRSSHLPISFYCPPSPLLSSFSPLVFVISFSSLSSLYPLLYFICSIFLSPSTLHPPLSFFLLLSFSFPPYFIAIKTIQDSTFAFSWLH